jgi:hypothetical protein
LKEEEVKWTPEMDKEKLILIGAFKEEEHKDKVVYK